MVAIETDYQRGLKHRAEMFANMMYCWTRPSLVLPALFHRSSACCRRRTQDSWRDGRPASTTRTSGSRASPLQSQVCRWARRGPQCNGGLSRTRRRSGQRVRRSDSGSANSAR
eukprot:7685839-Lingulodinium_polyedra.AAC.1